MLTWCIAVGARPEAVVHHPLAVTRALAQSGFGLALAIQERVVATYCQSIKDKIYGSLNSSN